MSFPAGTGAASHTPLPDLPHCTEPRPLLAAFFLGGNGVGKTRIRAINGAAAHSSRVSGCLSLDIEDQIAPPGNPDQVANFVHSVPGFAPDYLRDLEALDHVRAAIVDHSRSTGLAA